MQRVPVPPPCSKSLKASQSRTFQLASSGGAADFKYTKLIYASCEVATIN